MLKCFKYYILLFILSVFWHGAIAQINPNSVQGLTVWLTADSVTITGGGITVCKDLSNNGNDAIQGSNANMPIKINAVSGLNSYPIMRFDGTDDFLEILNNASINFDTSMTVFLVMKENVSATNQGIICKWDYGSQGSFALQTDNNTASELRIFIPDSPSDPGLNRVNTLNANINTTNFSLLTNSYNGSLTQVDRLKLYKNGTLVSTSTDGSIPNVLQASASSLKIGKFGGQLDRYFSGDIAEILIYNKALHDTNRVKVENYLREKYAPEVNLGQDIAIAYGFCDTTLNAGSNFVSYNWSTGESTSTIQVNQSGLYWVQTTDAFNTVSTDTINVSYSADSQVPASPVTICQGDVYMWDLGLPNNSYTFLWNNNSTDSTLAITAAGLYSATITDNLSCQFKTDTLSIVVNNFPTLSLLPSDTTLCAGNIITPLANNSIISYNWSNGTQTPGIVINQTDTIILTTVDTLSCLNKDTIIVNIQGVAPVANFTYASANFCKGSIIQFSDSSVLNAGDSVLTYEWKIDNVIFPTNSSQINFAFSDSGTHVVSLIIYAQSGCNNEIAKSIHIYPNPKSQIVFTGQNCIGNNITFDGQTSIDYGYPIDDYSWEFGDNTNGNGSQVIKQYNQTGNYTVTLTVESTHGCVNESSTDINLNPQFFCEGANAANGLVLWLSADYGVDDTLAVGQWLDKSGNNNHATQNTSTSKPIAINNYRLLNNKVALRLNGVDDFLEIADNATLDFDTTMTIFIVANKQQSLLDDEALLSNWDYGHNAGSWALQIDNSVNKELRMYVPDSPSDGGLNRAITTDANFSDNYFSIICGKYDGQQIDTNRISFYRNSQMLTSHVDGTINPTLQNSISTLMMGKFGGTIDRYYKGDIAEVIIYNKALHDTDRVKIENYLRLKYAPPVDLGQNININYGFCDTTISAQNRFLKYIWNTGDTTYKIAVNKSGWYKVTTTDAFGYTSTDSVKVTFPSYNQLSDSTICNGNSINWDIGLGANYNYLWSDSSTGQTFNINTAGNYFVSITDTLSCVYTTDIATVNIDMYANTTTIGGIDTSLCSGNTLGLLNNINQTVSYTWSTFETSATIAIADSGSYSLATVDINNCLAFDTIFVHIMGQAPTANFVSNTKCKDDFSAFIDSSLSSGSLLNSWHWNFGDLSTDTIQNPNHIYSNPGIYNVSLLISGVDGCKAFVTKPVTIYKQPIANFYNYWSCNNDSTKFFNISNLYGNSVQSTYWKFNDPASGIADSSFINNAKHLYYTVGNHSVQLIVTTQNGCVDSITKNIDTKIAPIADFITSPICENTTTLFNDVSTIQTPYSTFKRTWNFGDGISNGPQPQGNGSIYHFYSNTSNSYTASLTIVSSSGCKDSISKILNVGKVPIANFSYSNNCPNTLTNLLNTSTVLNDVIANTKWYIDSVLYNSFNLSTPLAAGTHNVSLIVKSSQLCTDGYFKTIIVKPLPDIAFSLDAYYGNPPFEVITNNTTTNASAYNWHFGNGETSSLFEPTTTFNDSGKFEIKLVAFNSDNCSDTAIKFIDVIPSHLDIAITAIKVSNKNNFSEITVDLANLGTEIVNTMDLIISADNQNQSKEMWTGSILPSYIKTYTLTSSVKLSENSEYICVTADNINSKQDQKPENNTNCNVLISNFTLPSPMPNPAFNTIAIPIILPDKGSVIFTAYDSKGALLTSSNLQLVKGINFVDFDITKWNADVYFYTVKYNDETLKQSFVKIQQ